MNTRTTILHSEIKNIYPRVDVDGNPYIRIETNEYDNQAMYNVKHIKTDTVGIYGKFEEVIIP